MVIIAVNGGGPPRSTFKFFKRNSIRDYLFRSLWFHSSGSHRFTLTKSRQEQAKSSAFEVHVVRAFHLFHHGSSSILTMAILCGRHVLFVNIYPRIGTSIRRRRWCLFTTGFASLKACVGKASERRSRYGIRVMMMIRCLVSSSNAR